MQMFIESRTMYQIRLRSPLGKGLNLFGIRTCTNSRSLTGVKWCDFYHVLRHCEMIASDYSVFAHNCQTISFLHQLVLPALAGKKVCGQY